MSKFFKALEQAELDRALRGGVAPGVATASEAMPPGQARPPVIDPPVDGVDSRLVSLMTPAAFEAEQYRALRHAIEQLQRSAGLKVIAVSSPGAGDGKSITSVNLAGALAQSPDARVLLVDADLRRPTLGHLLGLRDAEGMSLVDGISSPGLPLDRIVRSRPPFNLSVICAGSPLASPYEALKSPRLGELLGEARRQYDFVVLDTPPVQPVQDCRVIGRWVDGFLLVVSAHQTPRRLVEDALTTLDPSKLLGIVLNGAERPGSRYQQRYGYYAPAPLPPTGHATGALRRAARRFGDSVRGPRPASTRDLPGGHR
jgi:capsular exopolysaccharide synthesis family protein